PERSLVLSLQAPARVASVAGGGWLCVNYDWRYIFLINVPIGLFSLLAVYWLVEDPDYIQQEVGEYRRQPLSFDFIGLGVLSLVMASWEIMLSKGQEWDWLGDPFGRVQTLLALLVGGAGLPDLPRAADRESDHQLPLPPGAQPGAVLRHHVLRLRRGLLLVHRAAVTVAGPVRLRRAALGPDDVAGGGFLTDRD